jgi:hypothetical protein
MMIIELFDVYLAMACSVVLAIMLIPGIKRFTEYFKARENLRCLYKYLSRMKLPLSLYKWWQADNMTRYKCKTPMSTKQVSLKRKKMLCKDIRAYEVSSEAQRTYQGLAAQGYNNTRHVCNREVLPGAIRQYV